MQEVRGLPKGQGRILEAPRHGGDWTSVADLVRDAYLGSGEPCSSGVCHAKPKRFRRGKGSRAAPGPGSRSDQVASATAHNDPRPERILSKSDWKFPSKAIDQTDGSIAAAVHWRDRAISAKDRRFKEPGIIIGMACATPKVYLGNQRESTIDHLTRSLDWLPAVLGQHAFTSLKLFQSTVGVSGTGPLGSIPSSDYYLDIRDLFVHGDQMVNFALTATDANLVALPSAAGKTRFVSSTDANNLFADSGTNKVHAEGRTRLNLLSHVTDMTPNA